MMDGDSRIPMMPNTVWLQQGRGGLHFTRPVSIVVARRADEVVPALQAIEAAVIQHRQYAAGFISYEAAAAYDLAVHDPMPDLPLLWFGLYEQAALISDWRSLITQQPVSSAGTINDWQPAIRLADYESAVRRIKDYLADGHSYCLSR